MLYNNITVCNCCKAVFRNKGAYTSPKECLEIDIPPERAQSIMHTTAHVCPTCLEKIIQLLILKGEVTRVETGEPL